jgi:hypothetical protein
MPIQNINTPNLATELADIDTITGGISVPNSLDTYIKPIIKLKPTQDCEALILKDFTDYQELYPVDISEVTITFSYGLLSDCGCEIDYICQSLTLEPTSSYVLDNLEKDGVYCVEIQMNFSTFNPDAIPPEINETKTFNVSFRKDCCEKEYKNISRNVWGKMSDLACSIATLSKIGRNVKEKKKSYLKLSNLLYLYYYLSKDACEEKEIVLCTYNKIK